MVSSFPTQSPHGMIEQSPHGMRGQGGKFARITIVMIVDESYEGGGSGGYWAVPPFGDAERGARAFVQDNNIVLSTIEDAADWLSPEGIPLMPNGVDDLDVYVLHTAANPDWERTNPFYFGVTQQIGVNFGWFPIGPTVDFVQFSPPYIRGIIRTPLTFRDGPASQGDTYDRWIPRHFYRNQTFLTVSVKNTDVGLGGPNGPNMIDADVWASRVSAEFPKLRTRRIDTNAFPTFFAQTSSTFWVRRINSILERMGQIWRSGD